MGHPNKLNRASLLERIPDLNSVYFFEELDSTSDFAKSWIAEPSMTVSSATQSASQLPALIYTSRQTRGRGRAGKSWFSGVGSMTFTFVVEGSSDHSAAKDSLLWGCATAIALNRFSGSGDSPFLLKWPNDIIAGRGKVAGILIESVAQAPSVRIVGIGINLNNESFLPLEDSPFAPISFFQTSGKKMDPLDLLGSLWENFRLLQNRPLEDLLNKIREIDFLEGKTVRIAVPAIPGDTSSNPGVLIEGRYKGLSPNGSLRLRVGDQTREFQSASIVDVTG